MYVLYYLVPVDLVQNCYKAASLINLCLVQFLPVNSKQFQTVTIIIIDHVANIILGDSDAGDFDKVWRRFKFQ